MKKGNARLRSATVSEPSSISLTHLQQHQEHERSRTSVTSVSTQRPNTPRHTQTAHLPAESDQRLPGSSGFSGTPALQSPLDEYQLRKDNNNNKVCSLQHGYEACTHRTARVNLRTSVIGEYEISFRLWSSMRK